MKVARCHAKLIGSQKQKGLPQKLLHHVLLKSIIKALSKLNVALK